MAGGQEVLWWCVVLVGVHGLSHGKTNPYVDDTVARPSPANLGVLDLAQVKVGGFGSDPAQFVSSAGENDVTVAGVIYSKGNVHSGGTVAGEGGFKTAQSVEAKKDVVAGLMLKSHGSLEVSKGITAGSIQANGDVVVDGNVLSKGVLTVELALNAQGLLNAEKGVMSGGIIRSTNNIVSEKSVIATGLLQSDAGIYTKGSVNVEQRLVAKKDLHTEALVTARKGFVTPGNVFAENSIKAGNDIRAGNFIYASGLQLQKHGMHSKGPIQSTQDIAAGGKVLATGGIQTDGMLHAKNISSGNTESTELTVTGLTNLEGQLQVAGHAKLASATVQGKLYVGTKEVDVDVLQRDVASMKQTLKEMMSKLEEMQQ